MGADGRGGVASFFCGAFFLVSSPWCRLFGVVSSEENALINGHTRSELKKSTTRQISIIKSLSLNNSISHLESFFLVHRILRMYKVCILDLGCANEVFSLMAQHRGAQFPYAPPARDDSSATTVTLRSVLYSADTATRYPPVLHEGKHGLYNHR